MCDLRHPSQCKFRNKYSAGIMLTTGVFINIRVRGKLRQTRTAPRSHHKERSKESTGSKALLRESNLLKWQQEEEDAIQSPRKKPAPNEASEDVRRGNRLMLLGFKLPEIDPSSFDMELLKQSKEEQEHPQMLEVRSMRCLRKPIVDIEKAFRSFKIQETDRNITGPSNRLGLCKRV